MQRALWLASPSSWPAARSRETRQDDRMVAYTANSDALYPGARISTDAVRSGPFTQIVLPRAPV